MAPTVYLVSGANRGIGLAIVTQLAAHDNVVVFAGARNPAAATDLQALKSKYPGKLYPVKLAAANKADNQAAVAEIEKVAGRLDVVLANAGQGDNFEASDKVSFDAMRSHFETNVLGPLGLFQATWPLLKTSSKTPKFFITSSVVGSIQMGTTFPWNFLAYGSTKAAANFLAAKLYHEFPELIVYPLHPGVVKTDLATEFSAGAPGFGDLPAITPQESAAGIIKVVESATRTEAGPKLTGYDGSSLPW